MAIKFITIFQSKALQKITQIVIFVLKINHLATLPQSYCIGFRPCSGVNGLDSLSSGLRLGVAQLPGVYFTNLHFGPTLGKKLFCKFAKALIIAF
jgi:hypothetical protein